MRTWLWETAFVMFRVMSSIVGRNPSYFLCCCSSGPESTRRTPSYIILPWRFKKKKKRKKNHKGMVMGARYLCSPLHFLIQLALWERAFMFPPKLAQARREKNEYKAKNKNSTTVTTTAGPVQISRKNFNQAWNAWRLLSCKTTELVV